MHGVGRVVRALARYSAMVTTVPKAQNADLVFTKYKQPGYSEPANHEFKTPLAVHPLFLKSPRRVEALVFLMIIGLTTYFLLQRLGFDTPARILSRKLPRAP